MIEFDKLSDFFKVLFPFEKNEKELYLDLHMHTTASDGSNKIEYLNRFLKDKNHLISITDHNSIASAVALSKTDVNNVPGIELGCNDGFELLVYFDNIDHLIEFYESEVVPHRHPTRMARTTKDVMYYLDILENMVCHISIPHINGLMQKNFVKNKPYLKDVLKRVDSIETYNHNLSKKRNLTAAKLRKEYELEATFGSDAHINRELVSYYLFFNEEEKLFHNMVSNIYKIKLVSGIGHKHLVHTLRERKRNKLIAKGKIT